MAMVTVYSGQAAAASGKRTSPLPVNCESGAALASGFLGEYPIHSASAGRAEGHREGCAPACSYGRLPGSLSAPPEMPHRPQPAGPLPVRGCGGRAGQRGAGPPLVASTLTHCPVIFRCPHPPADRPLVPGGGRETTLLCVVLPSPPTLLSNGAWLSPLSARSARCWVWRVDRLGPEVTPPAALGLKWQSL